MANEEFSAGEAGDKQASREEAQQTSSLQLEWMSMSRPEKLELASVQFAHVQPAHESVRSEKGAEKTGFDIENTIAKLEKNPSYGDIAKAWPQIRTEIEKRFKEMDNLQKSLDATDKMNRMEKLLNDLFVSGRGDRVNILQMSSQLSQIWHKHAKQFSH